jgi:hypothetical protein
MIDGEERQFGACDIEIADRKIEPRPAIHRSQLKGPPILWTLAVGARGDACATA